MIGASASSRQIPALDGIRGVAITWVVLHNCMALELVRRNGIWHLIVGLAGIGWIGVELFFGLSGFLITAGLLDSQGTQRYFRNFYAKRALRILPLYYTTLFVLLVILPHFVGELPYSHDPQAPLWLLTINWTQSTPYGFGHFWSLAVEEQFYLVWPLIFWRLPPRRLLTACIAIAAGALLLRCILVAARADWYTLYVNTLCRMDALALGAVGACALRIPEMRRQVLGAQWGIGEFALALFLSGAALTHLYDRERWPCQTFGYSLLAICSAAFVTVVAGFPRGRSPVGVVVALLSWRPLRSCGKYSYAMYVFHNLLHKLIGEPWLLTTFGRQPPVQFAFLYALAVFAASYALAFCSYHALEQHFLKLKRFFYRH
jgi:peptidoglycan/LPS O-acetylase OafA/YrhL